MECAVLIAHFVQNCTQVRDLLLQIFVLPEQCLHSSDIYGDVTVLAKADFLCLQLLILQKLRDAQNRAQLRAALHRKLLIEYWIIDLHAGDDRIIRILLIGKLQNNSILVEIDVLSLVQITDRFFFNHLYLNLRRRFHRNLQRFQKRQRIRHPAVSIFPLQIQGIFMQNIIHQSFFDFLFRMTCIPVYRDCLRLKQEYDCQNCQKQYQQYASPDQTPFPSRSSVHLRSPFLAVFLVTAGIFTAQRQRYRLFYFISALLPTHLRQACADRAQYPHTRAPHTPSL